MTENKNQESNHCEKLDEQDVLHDFSNTGKERPWAKMKNSNSALSVLYQELGNNKKSRRLDDCATFLRFVGDDTGNKKLKQANFCRIRLCPICQWRRSLKVFSQLSSIVQEIEKDEHYGYILLTLTIQNTDKNALDKAIGDMMIAWHNFAKYKIFKDSILGYYRAFEITHNVNIESKSYNTYHPHFHCLLVVNSSYFSSNKYIKQSLWCDLWQRAAKLDYTPQVNVQRVHTVGKSMFSAIAEAAKYAVKPEDYIIPDDLDLSLDTLKLLDTVLDRRRFIGFGGILKDAMIKLRLDDAENGDLLNVGDNVEITKESQGYLYFWRSGYSQYVLLR